MARGIQVIPTRNPFAEAALGLGNFFGGVNQQFQQRTRAEELAALAQQVQGGGQIDFGGFTDPLVGQLAFQAMLQKQQEPGFTLTPGAERFGPGGERIAQVPQAPPSPVRGVPFTTPEGRTVFVDPTTGRQIPTDLPTGATSPLRPLTSVTVGDAKITTNSLTLGRSFRTDERIKDMRTIEKFTQNMVTALARSKRQKINLGPIDIALAKSFQKLTDLGSTVREGEFATTFEGQRLINKVRGKLDAIITGGLGFTPEDRQELVDLALALQKDSQKLFNQAITEFSVTSDELGLKTRAVLGGVKPFDVKAVSQEPAQRGVKDLVRQNLGAQRGQDATRGIPPNAIQMLTPDGRPVTVPIQTLKILLERDPPYSLPPGSNIQTATNPQTNERMVSFDGGATWRKL